MHEKAHRLFSDVYGHAPEVVAYAPGRIEFIGNHTDYNGGPVLGATIDRGVWVALARRSDGKRRYASDYLGDKVRITEESEANGALKDGPTAWINYPMGVLSVLPSFGFRIPAGFEFLAVSDLPSGSGLSSSAAVELASTLAFLAVTKQGCPPDVLAQIGRRAENEYVGVPCGILDQGVSAHGRENHLVLIDCRRLGFSQVPLPAHVRFWVFNTHAKHALVDGLYADRHRQCMQAALVLGVEQLADASLKELYTAKDRLPSQTMRRARHVLEEISRVNEAVRALAAGAVAHVGSLMTASHRSSQVLFENSTPELDFLVDALVEMPDVFGARLTGGGFGGAVLALTGPGFDQASANDVAALYSARFGTEPEVLRLRSGEGARVIKGLEESP
jgi:galactokinase